MVYNIFQDNHWYHETLHFAAKAHDGQYRKGSKVPYIVHPIGVAEIVATHGGDNDHIRAALLHDVIEDCDYSYQDIMKLFGPRVAELVLELTNVYTKENFPDWNREKRKKAENERMAKMTMDAKLVKMADIWYNINDGKDLDEGFNYRLMREKNEAADAVYNNAFIGEHITSLGIQALYIKIKSKLGELDLRPVRLS